MPRGERPPTLPPTVLEISLGEVITRVMKQRLQVSLHREVGEDEQQVLAETTTSAEQIV
jgi:hypothetical protein